MKVLKSNEIARIIEIIKKTSSGNYTELQPILTWWDVSKLICGLKGDAEIGPRDQVEPS